MQRGCFLLFSVNVRIYSVVLQRNGLSSSLFNYSFRFFSFQKENLNSKTDEYFLCNTDKIGNHHSVIGTHVLSKQPAVTFTKPLTALTLSVVDTKIIAFLGTESGDIVKVIFS
jgi:hypothetical protein